jgi:hypothetical protein
MLGNHTALSRRFYIKASIKRNVTSQERLPAKYVCAICKFLNARMGGGGNQVIENVLCSCYSACSVKRKLCQIIQ